MQLISHAENGMAASKINRMFYPFIDELIYTTTAADTEYTPSQDCIAYIFFTASVNSRLQIYVDGNIVFRAAAGAVQNVGYVSNNESSATVFVKAGQRVTFTANVGTINFYSLKG